MTDAQAVRCRKRLEQFLVDLLEPVGRSERRHWGEVYVRSLLLEGERQKFLSEDWPRIYATIQRLGLRAEDLLTGATRRPSSDTARAKPAESKSPERKR